MFPETATDRLVLTALSTDDHAFIKELVNTKGWLQFIGDRNVRSEEDAIAYINKINGLTTVQYWVARLAGDQTPIGIITFIKRDYLEHADIGFAFLPQYNGKGYAYEAAKAVLDMVLRSPDHSTVLATTLPKNLASIKLLTKLGLRFEKEITAGADTLHVYATKQ